MKEIILGMVVFLVVLSTAAFARDIYMTGQYITNNEDMKYNRDMVYYRGFEGNIPSYSPLSSEGNQYAIYSLGTCGIDNGRYQIMSGKLWRMWSSTESCRGDTENRWRYSGEHRFIRNY